MSRRRFIASSSEYEPPMSEEFEQDLEARLKLLNLLENPAPRPVITATSTETNPASEIARMLSAKSAVSTTSSFAMRQNRALEEALSSHARTFRKIGAGSCGAVFAADGQSLAFKIGKMGVNDDSDALWTDFKMHQRILEALRESRADIEIPTCHFFINYDDQAWWAKHKNLAATAQEVCHIPARVLITERILPMPEPIRLALIQQFCKPNLRATATADPANKDCLVRVYLGSFKGRMTAFFSLRNFKLHLNQMIEIGLDYEGLAVSMGQVLAIIHWQVGADARDIEFALGSSSTSAPENDPASPNTENFTRRETRLFVLDFNQVQDITMDDAGVEQAVEAFFLNDPYYPRPRQEGSRLQQELWNSFVRSYLSTADAVLAAKDRVLSRKFISGIIDHASTRASAAHG